MLQRNIKRYQRILCQLSVDHLHDDMDMDVSQEIVTMKETLAYSHSQSSLLTLPQIVIELGKAVLSSGKAKKPSRDHNTLSNMSWGELCRTVKYCMSNIQTWKQKTCRELHQTLVYCPWEMLGMGQFPNICKKSFLFLFFSPSVRTDLPWEMPVQKPYISSRDDIFFTTWLLSDRGWCVEPLMWNTS